MLYDVIKMTIPLHKTYSDCSSAPGGARTRNLWIRSPLLYPIELRGRLFLLYRNHSRQVQHRLRRQIQDLHWHHTE